MTEDAIVREQLLAAIVKDMMPDLELSHKSILSSNDFFKAFPYLSDFKPIVDNIFIYVIVPILLVPVTVLDWYVKFVHGLLKYTEELACIKRDLPGDIIDRLPIYSAKYNKQLVIITDLICRPLGSRGRDILAHGFPGD